MEREVGRGREMMKERRRGGGEMRKGIVIGGMVIGLLMGCNNGIAELEKKNQFLSSVVSLGNEFLGVFTSFTDMFSSSLGFKSDPKKSDVANYFNKLKETVQGTKDKLSEIINNMEKEGNPNAANAKGAVNKLVNETLDKIIKGANTASEAIGTDNNPIGNVAPGGAGGAGDAGGSKGEVEKLVNGIKDIVGVVLSKDEGNPDAGTDKKAEDGSSARNNNDGAGMLFANDKAGANATNTKKVATDAAKAVGAVTGADILQAMVKDGGKAITLANHNGAFASNVAAGANAKDAEIAGGIALRAMSKGGKFANAGDSATPDVVTAVKGAAVSAVTKALDTLTIAIRKTIDEGLKTVKEAMKINPEDTAVISEANAANNK